LCTTFPQAIRGGKKMCGHARADRFACKHALSRDASSDAGFALLASRARAVRAVDNRMAPRYNPRLRRSVIGIRGETPIERPARRGRRPRRSGPGRPAHNNDEVEARPADAGRAIGRWRNTDRCSTSGKTARGCSSVK
jgi:hypothetical protein